MKGKEVSDAKLHLKRAAEIWDERQLEYKSSYRKGGMIMKSYFPEGVTLTTEEDFMRFVSFLMCSLKLNRYSEAFNSGGHMDSANDLINYAAILSEATESANAEGALE